MQALTNDEDHAILHTVALQVPAGDYAHNPGKDAEEQPVRVEELGSGMMGHFKRWGIMDFEQASAVA
ncbi:hypothetical protein FBQ96_06185 [Nitrospirales bacterium NOB]|nr:hypothetical protein [Nitrospira sp. NTP2]MDL1889158.1 hypothetical protein [Nitrospirales bacterium NOB]RIK57657.1 MAG: hypothetical protein DCC63_13560 [Nitrospira sp.]